MPRNSSKNTKQSPNLNRPYPWRCRTCGKQEVAEATTKYEATVKHDGRTYTFTVPRLLLPVCRACGAKVFTESVDGQVNDALRSHLRLMFPAQIRDAIQRVNTSQKDVAARLGIAEATLSRWLNGIQIQSRAMDNLMRAFFALPQVRTVLCGDCQDPSLGFRDVTAVGNMNLTNIRTKRDRVVTKSRWSDDWNGKREACRQVQELVQISGSTWGTRKVG